MVNQTGFGSGLVFKSWDIQQIRLNDNLTGLFTKSLPTLIFDKLIYKIRIRQLKDIDIKKSMLMT